jgi:hypothetical protein
MLKDSEEEVTIIIGRKHIIFKMDTVYFFTRMIEAEYMDYEKVLPKTFMTQVYVSKRDLISAIDRASIITEDKLGGNAKPPVKIDFVNNTIELSSISQGGSVYEKVPCAMDGADLTIGFNCRFLLDSLKSCMGPLAMIIAGATIAKYDLLGMFKKKKVYIATALRLIIIPTVILTCLFGIKELANLIFGLAIDNTPLLYLFFILATPLGLNTVVFPEAYGGDPETGASMAMISHTLCVISIPLMYALMVVLFGTPFGG